MLTCVVVTGSSVVGGGAGGGTSLVTVTVSAGGGAGGDSALDFLTDSAVLGGSVVALVLLLTLVNAIATPPTAINATAAASPNTNRGSRCHVRGFSIGPVAGTYCTG